MYRSQQNYNFLFHKVAQPHASGEVDAQFPYTFICRHDCHFLRKLIWQKQSRNKAACIRYIKYKSRHSCWSSASNSFSPLNRRFELALNTEVDTLRSPPYYSRQPAAQLTHSGRSRRPFISRQPIVRKIFIPILTTAKRTAPIGERGGRHRRVTSS